MHDQFLTEEDLDMLGIRHGRDVRISKQAVIRYPELVILGDHVAIDPFVFVNTQLTTGSYVHIATASTITGGRNSRCIMEDFSGISYGTCIVCGTDDFKGASLTNPTIPRHMRKPVDGTVTLKKHVIVGAHSVILPNVTVEEGTAIGALSLVNRTTEAWSIYAGIPARRLGERRRDTILQQEAQLRG